MDAIFDHWLEKKASKQHKKTAVIIRGNPDRITKETYNGIYEDLRSKLKGMGFSVTMDPGKAYTQPPDADVWIGHSKGVDRLRFAPKGTIAIPIGSDVKGALNHPDEKIDYGKSKSKSRYDKYDSAPKKKKRAHLTLHEDVWDAIRKKIR
jgi:hypothetical protein